MNAAVDQVTNQASPLNMFGSQEVLNKDDFFQLLVAQLRHQDPMDPMDNTEFVAQLAQFSTLEQMQNVSSGITNMSLLMQSVNNSLATELLGKNVKYLGDTIHFNGEDNVSINYVLASLAQVKIKIYDQEDNLMTTIIQGEQIKGDQSVDWNGEKPNGDIIPSGKYTFKIDAEDQDGNKVASITYAVDRVQGLKFDSGNAVLKLTDYELYLADIFEILEGS